MTDNDHEAAVQRVLRRVKYLLNRFLRNYCHEQKDGIWEKGTFEEKSRWQPDVNVCKECKHFAYLLERGDEVWESLY